ncbi:Fungal Zn(2)-Cys(6) binuclear cluster domain [Geosmithia morbida]|uniref:Fungal Zn(2)-Cys(6) binuclear cluster domain n=1 Tax=Geosmithia morbida TaxID=1094350 RepID=A0A9P4YUX9_9HYPO|nr:Fungal Zn(2)-Cys(6) binuclear cluster domain [Geosmithia morbida]KAF4122997.1 Fungal Zn(2)-Cys(6) binuclear cluster domain [Geosmithia morbida]
MTSRITTACNGCRIRKVKCDGAHPCSQCAHFELPCHFTAPRGKRKPGQQQSISRVGRKRSDGHSLSHRRRHQQRYTPDFFLPLIPDYEKHVYPVNPIITGDEMRDAVLAMDASHENKALVYAFAAVTINLTRTSRSGAMSSQLTDLVRRCLAAHRMADVDDSPSSFSSSSSSSSSTCSYNVEYDDDDDDDGNVKHPCSDAAVNVTPTLGELPVTVKRIMTCIFLEISLMAFRLFKRSFAILREAITMVQTLKVYRYSSASSSAAGSAHVARLQRLYWECFIHERFVNVMSGCPAMLQPLSTGLPCPDASIPPHVDVGFRCLIRLFAIMDAGFLAHWNAQSDPASLVPGPMTAAWVEAKQSELDRHEADTALHDDAMRAASTQSTGLSELQLADLFVTRLWLRTLVWQLALSNGLLRTPLSCTNDDGGSDNNDGNASSSSASSSLTSSSTTSASASAYHRHNRSEDLLSLHYPAAKLSSELRRLVCCLHDVTSIATHGSGILQKLFEITTTIADVLALLPLPPASLSSGPVPDTGAAAAGESGSATAHIEDFIFLVDFLFRFERVSNEERDYMRVKIRHLQAVFPGVGFENLLTTLA